ncbi:TPA: hypothetical protein WIU55_001897 [Neisseria meningitidis]|uniref:hypothetical protein n=1 Tax=Neisseria polysaccharea TaxID=489 RepID=UPI0018C4201A
MNTVPKSRIPVKPLPEKTTAEAKVEAKVEKWRQLGAEHGLSGEWAVAARLGENGFTEEQMENIANLFGR